jgi:hypothetical protein
MNIKKLLPYILGVVILLTGILACGSEKEAMERRSLMMPRKSEMLRNDRYKEVGKRKTNKVKLVKSKNRSLF